MSITDTEGCGLYIVDVQYETQSNQITKLILILAESYSSQDSSHDSSHDISRDGQYINEIGKYYSNKKSKLVIELNAECDSCFYILPVYGSFDDLKGHIYQGIFYEETIMSRQSVGIFRLDNHNCFSFYAYIENYALYNSTYISVNYSS